MKGLLYLGIIVLIIVVIYQLTKAKKSCYAPPRDENTVLPFVENFMANISDSQIDVYKDSAGFLNQREHPLTEYFQSNAYSGTDMGTFVGLESSAGDIPMTVIPAGEQYMYSNASTTTEYLPNLTSTAIPVIGTATTGGAPLES